MGTSTMYQYKVCSMTSLEENDAIEYCIVLAPRKESFPFVSVL